MTDRYQIGHAWTRSGLMRPGAGLRDALWKALRESAGTQTEIRWRLEGREDWQASKDALKASGAMLEFAGDRRGAIVLEVADSGGGAGPNKWLRLHKYTAEPTSTGAIPAVALATLATRRTIRFNNEISLAIPGERTLGLYAPRPLKFDPSYWSEHAYAAARDAGADNAARTSWSSDPAVLRDVLGNVTRYTLANYRRLGVVDHIFNGYRYRRTSSGLYLRSRYTGSDEHTTHTHTAFADHGGRKPPWL